MSKNSVISNIYSLTSMYQSSANMLCFGITGSGKTSSFILPCVKEALKENKGLIIFDFKGNLHTQVKMLCHQEKRLIDVVELGKLWGESINLLSLLNENSCQRVFDLLVGKIKNSSYWSNASFILFSSLLNLIDAMKEIELILLPFEESIVHTGIFDFLTKALRNHEIYESASFNCIYTLLTDEERLSDFIEFTYKYYLSALKDLFKNNEAFVLEHQELYLCYEKIHSSITNLLPYKNMQKTKNDDSGRYAVLGMLSTTLGNIAAYSFLNTNSLSIQEAVASKKIIIINVSNMDESIIAAINLAISDLLAKRDIDTNTPSISIIIDEAQKVLNQRFMPDTDVCREKKFQYIFATQDRRLLENRLGVHRVDEIERNINLIYSYKTNYDDKTRELKTFEYYDFSTNQIKKAIPIFFTQEQLESIELMYQKDKKILEDTNLKDEEDSILIHDTTLYSKGYALFKNIRTNIKRETPYISNKQLEAIKTKIANFTTQFSVNSYTSKNEEYLKLQKRVKDMEDKFEELLEKLEQNNIFLNMLEINMDDEE